MRCLPRTLHTSRRAAIELLGRTHRRLRQLASGEIIARTPRLRKQPAPKVERPRKVAARKEASPKPRKLRPPKPACPIIPRQPKMRQPRKQVFLPWYPKAVLQAYADLQQEGRMITVQTLAQRAGVQWTTAQKFLRREQGTVLFPLGSCQHRLEAAYSLENIPRNNWPRSLK